MVGGSGGDLVIGIDSSTTAVKAVAWDLNGRPVADGRAPLEIQNPQPDCFEQDAEAWWHAACLALRQVCSKVAPSRLRVVAIAHQRETFVPLGSDLRPLRPAILWLDQRARSLLPALASALDPIKFHQRTGKPLSANLAPPKIEWLRRHEPNVYAQTRYWLDTHAFLVHKLTGELATSTGSADPLGMFDMASSQWDAAVLDALQLDPTSLPALYPPGVILGAVTPRAAAETGLIAGTPVASGIGDGQAAAFAMGIHSCGSSSLSLGTSVIGGSLSADFRTSLAFRTMSGPLGTYIFETVILSGTQILNWLAKDILALDNLPQALTDLETAASAIPPGSMGLVLVPYWNGAMNPYWDSSASGILIGLRSHHRAAHLFRSALEGIAFEIRLHLEGVETALTCPIQNLIVSGGGARSLLWLQIIADVTGKHVTYKEDYEASSLGSAMLAASAGGFYSSPTSASSAMASPVSNVISPSAERMEHYHTLYTSVYRPLYPAIRAQISALKHLEENHFTPGSPSSPP